MGKLNSLMNELKIEKSNIGKEKTLPSNIEAEQALIGSILVNNDIIDEISNIVSNKDFKVSSGETGYERTWWVMTKASGGNMNVMMYATPHKTRSEMLAPDFALRANVVRKMSENKPEMSLGGAWTWTQNQVLKLRRDFNVSSVTYRWQWSSRRRV